MEKVELVTAVLVRVWVVTPDSVVSLTVRMA